MHFSQLIAATVAALISTGDARAFDLRSRRDDFSPRTLGVRNHYDNGQIRPFTQQGGYGSCGLISEDDEVVVAVSYKLQGTTMPPMYCGRRIQIAHEGADRYEDGTPKDRLIEAVVVDTCTTCDSSHLELSVAAFEQLVGGTWDAPGPIGKIRWDVID